MLPKSTRGRVLRAVAGRAGELWPLVLTVVQEHSALLGNGRRPLGGTEDLAADESNPAVSEERLLDRLRLFIEPLAVVDQRLHVSTGERARVLGPVLLDVEHTRRALDACHLLFLGSACPHPVEDHEQPQQPQPGTPVHGVLPLFWRVPPPLKKQTSL